jgi:hypothetical protein
MGSGTEDEKRVQRTQQSQRTQWGQFCPGPYISLHRHREIKGETNNKIKRINNYSISQHFASFAAHTHTQTYTHTPIHTYVHKCVSRVGCELCVCCVYVIKKKERERKRDIAVVWLCVGLRWVALSCVELC